MRSAREEEKLNRRNMDKLIAVEFSPSSRGKRGELTPFYGNIGETLLSLYQRARDPLYGKGVVPVRFPLLVPNSRIHTRLWDRDLLDPILLREEGLDLNVSDIYPIKRTPVSLYKRKVLETPAPQLFRDLFESKHYLSTYSKAKFIRAVESLRNVYQYAWVWKCEWDRKIANQCVFVEARFYGIDTAVTTYDTSRFDGIVIEILLRPPPPSEHPGIKRSRIRSDVYLASNYVEYIGYIDGVQINREGVQGPWPHHTTKPYDKVITPKEHVRARIIGKKQ